MDWFYSLFSSEDKTPPIKDVKTLQNALLMSYHNGDRDIRSKGEEIFDMVDQEFPMNSVCSNGPLFSFVLDLKPFLTLNVIQKMIDGGLDFGHVHMKGIAHSKLLRELEFNYSDNLWGIFVYICQYTNFIQTLPVDTMFDIFFGKICIERGDVFFEFEPNPMVFKVMLAYDKQHRIKRSFFQVKNASLRECVKQKLPEISKLIINN